jgi:signal transduction histidine kinase
MPGASRARDDSLDLERSLDPERAMPALRRARRAGPGVIAAVVVIAAVQHPRPGLSGTGLAVSLALIVLVASTIAMFGPTASRLAVAGLGAMIAASAALVWLQPGGAGIAGLFVAVAFAGFQLTQRESVAALLLSAAAFVAAAMHGDRSGGTMAGAELGIVAFYLFARFARSAADAHEETTQLLAELQASRNAEAEAAMLRERSRLARDMHDVLAHSLSGLMLQLEGARMLAAQPDADGRLPPALDRAHHLARAGLEEARRAIAALRDEDLPGPDRLEQLAAEFERDSNIQASFELSGTPRRLDSEVALTLYRVAQEALTNARRHALPERVRVRLSYEAGGIRLTISDHASARPAAVAAATSLGGGYGLTGMRERAKLIGGRLDAGPTADGFQVELWIPA